ncbi:probable ergosterol biosynthetic protein 28 isoform X3 [Gopherus evgoodei]|uniref:Ergosterol biosynthesis 28 homolog n=2 Tax=Gopherus evgoodei TaxID=1825980 RepID=A0A8C4VJB9_9SAUR|nr:probable ergosterol biosynthetic protein 28 isoform X3 [Gopherus evgoodei]XP_030414966.1 probable ergosterol biosynthetic protein 28 isoform X3 [Gopherus evgoodei]XP_030414967.1 probable ergosterol biosynthetic protein 28 isoform X3 [Gopherus evgoodei]XP_030414968.1 probable ergosterol biosynthetic protein 28 isoform X3 [Gopherus evgoodei]
MMSRFLNVLRSWLVMVSIIAMGNTLQNFRDHSFLSEKLYTGKPSLVNGLQARTFGIWTLLSSVIRCSCAIDIHNKTFLHPGHVNWAAIPGHGCSVTKQEEKLKPMVAHRLESPACGLHIFPAILPPWSPLCFSSPWPPAVRS